MLSLLHLTSTDNLKQFRHFGNANQRSLWAQTCPSRQSSRRQASAEAVWKRAFLLISLNNQEMLDEAFH
jgi:hypothetical protein